MIDPLRALQTDDAPPATARRVPPVYVPARVRQMVTADMAA